MTTVGRAAWWIALVLALALLVALTWIGLAGGLKQLPQAETAGQLVQTIAQLGYGALSPASIVAAVQAHRWAPRLHAAWAVSVTVAGGLAPVVWGESGWATGAGSACAALAVALLVTWSLRSATAMRARAKGVGAGEHVR